MKGYVFDIRRYSIHDGAGIRTTIFLKGCPLKCIWCQNPEGIKLEPQAVFYRNNCIGCKVCLQHAGEGGMYWNDGICQRSSAREDWQKLEYECPANAIKVIGQKMSVEEIFGQIEKDRPFYKYGGGITLSGGELLYQKEFAAEILKEAKKRALHTAIETSLFTDAVSLKEILPWVDQIYADLKIFDEDQHKKNTGVSNEKILNAMCYLLTSEYRGKVIVRTPLIPGITDMADNIREISAFIADLYPGVRYELLNYNPLCEPKYEVLNRNFLYKENPSPYSEIQMEQYRKTAAYYEVTIVRN